nr:MAG TPA: hypothetical protein [Caudoviricetes sp.]
MRTCRVGTNSYKMMRKFKWQHCLQNGSLSYWLISINILI